jgi:glucose/arabinose dehydrogenase
MLLAGCGGGDAELGSGLPPGFTSSTAPGDAPGLTTAPGNDTTAPAPGGGPGGTDSSPRPTSPPPNPGPGARPSELARVQLRLTRVASFDEPLAMAVRPGDGALYIAEKRGRIRAIRGSQVDPTPVLDIAADVSTGAERGLLGAAFSGDGRLYVNYTDKDGNTRVVEYGMAGGTADAATRREVLFVDQPFANNNGGNLVFGPDGKLWIGLGDGGGGGDPADNGQSLGSLLGKMLRIDPRRDGNSPYSVPSDNPFLGTSGARPEIWAFGLRNPRRYSFDRATGDLWIGDVGQNAREEIDFQPAGSRGGQNYGWARLEGTRAYTGRAPSNAVPPIYEYGRSGGNCGVTGGYVYRGSRISGLAGAYVYADYCVGELRALRQSGGQVVDERAFSVGSRFLSSFGQDQAGELYALTREGGVFRIEAA